MIDHEKERQRIIEELPEDEQRDFNDTRKSSRIADREDDYKSQRPRILSPDRKDSFMNLADETEDDGRRTYSEIMKERELEKEQLQVMQKIRERKREAEYKEGKEPSKSEMVPTKKRRWDMPTPDTSERSEWEPSGPEESKPQKNRSRWDETPVHMPPTSQAKSRWDETPVAGPSATAATPIRATPIGDYGFSTPGGFFPQNISMTPEQIVTTRWEHELDVRNREFTDDELDAILPTEGFAILEPPANYKPIRTPSRRLAATPTPYTSMEGFNIPESSMMAPVETGLQPVDADLPSVRPEDYQYFSKLFEKKGEAELSIVEARERKIMKLLLRIKSGTPAMRKSAMRQLTEKARDLGAEALFDQILPLLMSPTLENQERHLLVKAIDRLLFKLDSLVRPYVHKILVVVEPLLIEEDYFARVEGRELISNLAKAAGLPSMIAAMRPDLDHADEYVRNTTARAFAVVASALGIPSLMPFLRAACASRKSWHARHTGIKIIQQIALLQGCGVLPHLASLVDCIAPGLSDDQPKVRTISALAVAALAEASAPYGIEAFDNLLKPLWKGLRQHRGKSLAAFLKAVGFIVPLMDAEHASYYTKEVMIVLIREFSSADEDVKKIVLRVVQQCAATNGVSSNYLKNEVIPPFFKAFWVRRMALDHRNAKQLSETTVEIAGKVGVVDISERLVPALRDDSEPFRRMAATCIAALISKFSAVSIHEKLESQLIDGLIFAFQEQAGEDNGILEGFGIIATAFGSRMKPYVPQIASLVLWRLSNRTAKIRQLAADLVAGLAIAISTCGEDATLGRLGVVLYENLGEEYPDVLASILGALKAIVNVVGMNRMQPPIKELLPRLTPILRNRHERVQENCIELVGRIADRGAEAVAAREWMRICFELLDMLKAHRKSVRRAATNTFGYIARAIGPQDVLATLLNNLRVQERQNRVCTTVAIAIVAETCAPFTVLPALMNEYRVPELNVQNGVLKSLSFLFEYIGEMGRDYIYAITPLLEDALMDRDLVHRQTACSVSKHMALGVFGFGCEEALLHLLNLLFPNLFEKSPHVINAVIDAIDALRISLGPATLLQYLVQGLFHPARKVRDIYWKIYNNLYIGSQDALTAFYPRIEDEGEHVYQRHVMTIVI